ncbi:hypothetical protein TSOC_007202 [Tetrabaena socialis]|uniref:C3H1-type domain-containing protein n=1 Tax=Tetrabaena socialis TaxID=47790 RepID=A0A2J8A1M5_9CHLO|nr:hypothetical protein TSOC_007202 [Tetrabaena socialis]|eukprot:PNH06414.1 hypothetical protein TSOC_007202 [Tetrabaena socialis]
MGTAARSEAAARSSTRASRATRRFTWLQRPRLLPTIGCLRRRQMPCCSLRTGPLSPLLQAAQPGCTLCRDDLPLCQPHSFSSQRNRYSRSSSPHARPPWAQPLSQPSDAQSYIVVYTGPGIPHGPSPPVHRTCHAQEALPLHKTKLCKNWADGGGCPRGARCAFAHGEAELRILPAAVASRQHQPPPLPPGAASPPVAQRPAAAAAAAAAPSDQAELDAPPGLLASTGSCKTKICQAFSYHGNCRFGRSCIYIHPGEDDEDTPQVVPMRVPPIAHHQPLPRQVPPRPTPPAAPPAPLPPPISPPWALPPAALDPASSALVVELLKYERTGNRADAIEASRQQLRECGRAMTREQLARLVDDAAIGRLSPQLLQTLLRVVVDRAVHGDWTLLRWDHRPPGTFVTCGLLHKVGLAGTAAIVKAGAADEDAVLQRVLGVVRMIREKRPSALVDVMDPADLGMSSYM